MLQIILFNETIHEKLTILRKKYRAQNSMWSSQMKIKKLPWRKAIKSLLHAYTKNLKAIPKNLVHQMRQMWIDQMKSKSNWIVEKKKIGVSFQHRLTA